MRSRAIVTCKEKNQTNIWGDCEFLFAVTMFAPYMITIINGCVRYMVSNTHKLDTLFLYGLYAVLLLSCIQEISHRIQLWQIIAAALLVVCMLCSALISQNQPIVLFVLGDMCKTCFPAFFLAGSIRDFAKAKQYLLKFAIFIPYLYALITYGLGFNAMGTNTYSQSTSYLLLFPAIILLNSAMEKLQLKTILPFVLCVFMVLSYGARGPIACLLLYVTLKLALLLPTAMYHWKIALGIVLLVTLGIIAYINYMEILEWLMKEFEKLGYSTRTVSRLLDKTFWKIGRETLFIRHVGRKSSGHPFGALDWSMTEFFCPAI